MPICWIIAGPNGAGKTTFALEYLKKIGHCAKFINADLIAAGLSPLSPQKEMLTASRLFIQEINHHIYNQQENFAFETTLAGRTHLLTIKKLKQKGWQINMIYLALPSIAMSKKRVAERVSHGGHNISAEDIERRFSRSLKNLLIEFSPIVDHCSCFMNEGKTPTLIFEQAGHQRNIVAQDYFTLLQSEAEL